MASRYSNDQYGRESRGTQGWSGRGRTEQQGYEEERWRRNQEWSPSQDTEYQSGGSQGSPYGYGASGHGFDPDADRFGTRSGDYRLGGGEGDFRSFQGGQGGFGTSQFGYGGSGASREYGGPHLGGYGSDEFNRRELNQGRFGGEYGSYGQGQYGRQERFGSESGYDQTGSGFQGRFGSQPGQTGSQGLFGSSSDRQFGPQHSGFRGKGPKGYTRSDQRIEEDVNERLYDDYYLDASNIEVSVQSGTVTLSGNVEDRESKRRAEDIAESCSGVQQVQNNIRIESSSWFGNGSDSEEQGRSATSSQITSTGSSKKATSSGS